MTAWNDAIETLRPPRDGRDGPLPPLLLLLTVVTGLVDAASYLNLGHVFVANMTGNVIFLGFAIAGAKGLSIGASLLAIGAFLAGSVAGSRVGARFAGERLLLLRTAVAAQAAAVVAAVVVAAVGGDPVDGARRFALIALLGAAMGVQNATARRLAVPELTTTVLTLTLTGIAADSALAGGAGSKIGRRALAVGAMFLGGLVGAVLALKVDTTAPLALAAAVLAVTAAAAHVLRRASGYAPP
jgi:uncharacterized membrane protein YoaK (UPF0700 family)